MYCAPKCLRRGKRARDIRDHPRTVAAGTPGPPDERRASRPRARGVSRSSPRRHDSEMTEITIAVATGPSGGLSLENEIRLVKPALLYADRVTLISPAATLLQAATDVGASENLTMTI